MRLWARIVTYKQRPVSAALTVAFFAGFVKVFSFLQQALLARQLGTSLETDAFFIAQIVPMLAGGVLASALIMCLTRDFVLIKRLDEQPLGIIIIIGALFFGLTFLWATLGDPIVAFLGRGFNKETLDLSISLSEYMAIMIVLYSLAGAAQAYHNSRSVFLLPASLNSLPYLGGILALLFLVPSRGIHGLVYGLIFGLFVQTLGLLIPIFSLGFSASRIIKNIKWFMSHRFFRFSKSLFFIGTSLFISQLYFATNRSVSSSLGPGWVAIFGFSGSAFSLPLQLIITSAAIAFLPNISTMVAQNRQIELTQKMGRLIMTVIAIFVPVSIIFYLGSDCIISILFKGNRFDATAAHLAAKVLRGYSFGMLGFALKDIIAMILLSLGREKWAAYVGLACVAGGVMFNLMFLRIFGFIGIAGATALILSLNAAVLLIILSKNIKLNLWPHFKKSGWRLAMACLFMLMTYYFINLPFASKSYSGTMIVQLARLMLSLSAFIVASKVFKLPELESFLSRYAHKLRTK